MQNNKKYDYDVIVTGAGISGLTCAAHLISQKKKVLVLEQSSGVGGYFAGYRKEGFHFDTGIRAFESSGLVIPMLKQLDLYDGLDIEKSDVAFIFPDRIIKITGYDDIGKYYSWLKEKFPHEAGGIDAVHNYSIQISDFLKSLGDMTGSVFKPSLKAFLMIPYTIYLFIRFLIKLNKIKFLFKKPLVEVLEKHISDRSLINVISQKFFVGTPAYFGLGYIQLFLDYFYPARGLCSITDSLKTFIESKNGEIRCNSRVDRIITRKNKAEGVVLQDGTEITAGAVVHAGDGKWLYRKMIPRENISDKTFEKVSRAVPCESNLSVFIGTDLKPGDLPFENCHHVFFTPDYEGTTLDDRYNSPDYFKHVIQEISVPSMVSAKLSPEGKCGIELSAVTVPEFCDNWKRTAEQSTDEYVKLKNMFAGHMIDNLEKIIPDIRDHIEFIDVGTPYTNQRATMNSGGSITGWTLMKDRSFNFGSISRMFTFYKTPLKNLYHIGHWAFAPGGVPTCVLGSKLASGRLKKL